MPTFRVGSVVGQHGMHSKKPSVPYHWYKSEVFQTLRSSHDFRKRPMLWQGTVNFDMIPNEPSSG